MTACMIQRQSLLARLALHHHHHHGRPSRIRLQPPPSPLYPTHAAAAGCCSSRIIRASRGFSTTTSGLSSQKDQHVPLTGSETTSSLIGPMASPIPPQSPPPKPPRRARRRWVSAAIFLLIGGLSGTILRAVISPPPPLIAGSPADLALKADIQARALTLPLVKKLMADPAWSHHEAYQTVPVSDDTPRITTGPLGSSTGIGAYQHIFVHDDDAPVLTPSPSDPSSSSSAAASYSLPSAPQQQQQQQHPVLNILYLGTSTTSWPGVVHGGLLATVLDEHAARGALADPALRSASVGVLTANLELHYRRPTLAGEFYVARARAIPDTELEPKERGKRQRKIWVDVSLETMDGKECVGGRALFIVPRGGKALPSGAVTLPPSNR